MLDERVIRAAEMLSEMNLRPPVAKETLDFDPIVWATHPLIRSCSLEARGLLLELLCLDWLQGGKTPHLSITTLSRLVGASSEGDRDDDVMSALKELYDHGVLSSEVPGFPDYFMMYLKGKLPLFIFEEDEE